MLRSIYYHCPIAAPFVLMFITAMFLSSLNEVHGNATNCSAGINVLNTSTMLALYGSGVYSVNRYVFLGDSTSRDCFHTFSDIFHYKCPPNVEGDVRKCTQRVKRDPKQRNKVLSTAEFFPFGRKQGWKRSMTQAYRQTIQGYIAQMTSSDVLIFNMGLHFDETATSSGNFMSYYSNALGTLVKDLGLTTSYSRQRRCSNTTDPYLPLVLWRETLPQHYNSTNGHYPSRNSSNKEICVPLTPLQRLGSPSSLAFPFSATGMSSSLQDHKEGVARPVKHELCDPSCLPANWQNDAAGAVMQDLCVSSVAVWEDFSCLHRQHTKAYHDCSHLTEAGNHILVDRIVSHLFRLKNISVNIPTTPHHHLKLYS